MSFIKKTTASLALFAITSGMFITTSSAYTVAEVEAANKLADAGIIVKQVDPVNYQLDRRVLRQEIAAVARGLAKIPKTKTCVKMFKDVTSTVPNGWACYTIEALANNNLIAKNPYFRPEAYITKAESVGMIVKAVYRDQYQYNPTLTDSWQKQVVDFAVNKGIVSNFSNYNTDATRGFVIEMGAKALESENLVCNLLGECNGDGPGPVVNVGEAEATLSPDTPIAQNIPENSANTEFLKFNISAGKQDLKVNSITFERLNLGSRTDFEGLWLTQDGVIITRDKSLNSNDVVTLNLNGKSIKAGTTQEFTLNASMNSPTNTLNQFKLVSIDASSPVKVDNVLGNVMRTVSYRTAVVKIEKKGFNSDINVGEENATIGEFKLSEVNGSSKKDVILKSIRFKASGSADLEDDFNDLAVYMNNKKVSKETIVNGKYVTFKLDNLLLANGSSEFFSIKANVVDGQDQATISFDLRDGFDIYGVEKGTGIGVAFSSSSNGDLATYTLNAGRFIISRDSSSPLSQNVLKSTSDVTMLVAKVDLGQPVTVDRLFLNVATKNIKNLADLSSQVDNVSLYVNDTLISSVDSPTSFKSNKGVYIFNDNFELRDNDKITIKASFTDQAKLKSEISFSLDNTGKSTGDSDSFRDVEYLSNGDALQKSRLLGSANGQKFIVSNSTNASISRTDGYVNNQTVVAGAKDVVFEKFAIQAPTITSLNIRQLAIRVKDSKNISSNFGVFELQTADGQRIGSPSSIEGNIKDLKGGVIVFSGLDTVIPKNSQKEFRLIGNIKEMAVDTSNLSFEVEGSTFSGRSVFLNDNGDEISTIKWQGNPINLKIVRNATLDIVNNDNYSSLNNILVIGGSAPTEIAKVQLVAIDGTVKLQKFKIDLTGSSVTGDIPNVSSFELYMNGKKLDRSYTFKGNGNNIIDFGAGNGIEIIPGQNNVLSIKMNTNRISQSNGDNPSTGTLVHVKSIQLLKAITNGTSKEVDLTNSGGLGQNGLRNIDSSVVIVRSYPTFANSNVNLSGLDLGRNPVYRFKVTADKAGDIKLKRLGFNLSSNNVNIDVTPTNTVLRDLGANKDIPGTIAFDSFTNTDKAQNGKGVFTFSNPFTIDAGQTVEFELVFKQVTPSSDVNKISSLTVNLDSNASSSVLSAKKLSDVESLTGSNGVIWSDGAAVTYGNNTVDWFGTPGLPGLGNMNPVRLTNN